MKNVMFRKENGKIRVINDYELIKEGINQKSNGKYPCFDCVNGYGNKCPKVYDRNSDKDIKKYDFITDGYQINDEFGELVKFVVTECNDYVKEPRRESLPSRVEYERNPSVQEKRKDKRIKTKEDLIEAVCSLKMYNFDAENSAEADQTQRDLKNRGQIYDYIGAYSKSR